MKAVRIGASLNRERTSPRSSLSPGTAARAANDCAGGRTECAASEEWSRPDSQEPISIQTDVPVPFRLGR